MSQYDLVVIGSGPGGYVAAIHAAQGGLKTAIVEKESTERLGGTCLLRGCIPTKAMLNTADLIEKMNHAADFGISVKDAKIDMEKMHAYKDKVVQKNAGGVKYLMKKNKVDVHLGHGRIDGRGKVSVTDKDGKKTVLNTKNVILATGSACRDMPFAPVDHERILNSDDILQLPDIPKHLVVLGAGAVGSEFASVFLRYGSKVTLIELQDRVLPIEDEEVSAEVAKSFRKQGMTVLTSTKMTELKRVKDTVKLKIEGADGKKGELEASHVLVAIGRKSVLDDVGLNKTKIKLDDRGFVPVNDFMQTTEDWIYAIGDLLNTPWLAHVASKEGIHAVDHILGRNPRPINYGLVPNCTYCTPEVASVGLTEKAAKEKGYDVATGVFPFSAIGKAAILGATDGFVKIVSEKKYDQVLGLHIVGPKATELITEGTVAMQLESTLDELIATIHPHPTLAEAVGEAAHAATGHPLHI